MNSVTPRTVFSSLPLADLDDITGENTTMILSPHPDDESLACGGLIAESCARARPPIVVIMTDGTGSHRSSITYPPTRLRDLREREAASAVGRLGLPHERLRFMRLRDSHMPRTGPFYDSAIERLARLFDSCRCGAILAPWLYDPHCDHQATHEMGRVLAAKVNAKLLSYPVWGWLLPAGIIGTDQNVAGWRLDIRSHLTTKLDAINSYESQYSDLIKDDPNGFTLPADLLSVVEQPFETFLDTPW
jgi:LmbE family N-acetylglucosaminyl deacetylase